MDKNTSGYGNVGVGFASLYKNTTGYENVGLGRGALTNANTGFQNVAVGANALGNMTWQQLNTALGHQALNKSTGSYNVAVGANAGQQATSGNRNILIGYNVQKSAPDAAQELNIGDLIRGSMASADKHVRIDGGLQIDGLPASDPGIPGRLWNDGGIVQVSTDVPNIPYLTADTLPTASATVKGGVKVGPGLVMDGDVLGVKQAQYELIDRIPIGYEFIIDKPDDWDDNWSNYFCIDELWRIRTIGSIHATAPSWLANTFLRYTGEVVNMIELTKEPGGTPFSFSAAIMFGHLMHNPNSPLLLDCGFFSGNNVKISPGVITIPMVSTTYQRHVLVHVRSMPDGTYDSYMTDASQGGSALAYGASASMHGTVKSSLASNGPIAKFRAFMYPADKYNFMEGSYIEIWGVRV